MSVSVIKQFFHSSASRQVTAAVVLFWRLLRIDFANIRINIYKLLTKEKKITNHTNHTIILRTFHYYCYKALTLYIIIIINKVLYYMGFHFFILKFLIMILWFMICVIAIFFLLHCQPLCFSALLLRRQVRWDFLLVRTVVFWAIFLWDSRLWVFLQNLLLVYPEKCWFLRESWLTLQKEKEKSLTSLTPNPSPSGEGSE